MFAVIKTGGKQYRVVADDLLKVERLAGEPGDIVEFGEVLAVGEGADAAIGTPFVAGALVTAEVVEQGRGRTIIAFKKRIPAHWRVNRGPESGPDELDDEDDGDEDVDDALLDKV